jgi:hypothetical protein
LTGGRRRGRRNWSESALSSPNAKPVTIVAGQAVGAVAVSLAV